MPTLQAPLFKQLTREIPGAGRLPAWLEPHREKILLFMRYLKRHGIDLNDPQLHDLHIRFSERGVVMVAKAGRNLPKNADRLNRLQRIKFWEVVQKWAALDEGTRDKSKGSGRQQSNGHCVHSRQRVANSHNG